MRGRAPIGVLVILAAIAHVVPVFSLAVEPPDRRTDHATTVPAPGALATAPARASLGRIENGTPGFRRDSQSLGTLLLRTVSALLLVGVLALAAVALVKRLPGVRGFSADGVSRIRLLESHRLTPKLMLFVIDYDGRTILLAQAGDQLLELQGLPLPRNAEAAPGG